MTLGAHVSQEPLKGYWEETRRPIYSAILVLPFLLTYELGVLILQPKVINGGDAIIRRILNVFSVHAAFASVIVLAICFVVWQVRTKASFRIDPRKLVLKFVESLFFAIILFLFLGWLSVRLPHAVWPGDLVAMDASGRIDSPLLALVLYCGAGIYEELVFRVLLLALLMLVFTKLLHWEKAPAAAGSVVTGAILFSLFHYIGGEAFQINSFLQRTFAGIYFAAIYVTRSFGVAAASHALYDILVGIQYSLSDP